MNTKTTTQIAILIGQVQAVSRRNNLSQFGYRALTRLENALMANNLDEAVAVCSDGKQIGMDKTLPHSTFRRWQATIHAIARYDRDGGDLDTIMEVELRGL